MSVDKFGRHSSGQIYTEPGVSVRYVNNNFIRRDGSNEVVGELSMNTHKITNLAIINFRDAVTKHYADSRKPVITIWASHEGPLHTNAYEWSFGGGFAPSNFGHPMPTSVRVIIIINGNDVGPRSSISVHPGSYVEWRPFLQPIELSAEDHCNV